MPPCGRVGADFTTGHGSAGPVNFITGANTVYCNSQKCLYLGSMHPIHGCPSPNYQLPQYLTQGSSTVFFESKPAGRLGDMDGCPECLATGSGNVIVG